MTDECSMSDTTVHARCEKCGKPLLSGHQCKPRKPASYAPFYAAGLYPQLAEVFRNHGYALAVHGSVQTDFDLIAVPWAACAGDPADVMAELLEKFAVKFAGQDKPEQKPHGRISYRLALSFGDCSIDISFTPRLVTA